MVQLVGQDIVLPMSMCIGPCPIWSIIRKMFGSKVLPHTLQDVLDRLAEKESQVALRLLHVSCDRLHKGTPRCLGKWPQHPADDVVVVKPRTHQGLRL